MAKRKSEYYQKNKEEISKKVASSYQKNKESILKKRKEEYQPVEKSHRWMNKIRTIWNTE